MYHILHIPTGWYLNFWHGFYYISSKPAFYTSLDECSKMIENSCKKGLLLVLSEKVDCSEFEVVEI